MFNLAVKNFFEKNLPLKVYGNLKFFSLVTLLRSLLFAMTKLSAPLFEIMGSESWKTLVKITFSIKLTTKRAQKSRRTRKKSAIELSEVRSAVYDVI